MPLTSAEIQKNYRTRNPERFKQSLRKYQQAKWQCPCGTVVINQCRPNHLKTKKHADRMKLLEAVANGSHVIKYDKFTSSPSEQDKTTLQK